MPEKSDKPRREIVGEEMPDCSALYVIGYLFEVGPVMATGMGRVPLSNHEIDAWQRNSGIELTAWEAAMMRKLSAEYLSESNAAVAVDRKAPWGGDRLSRKFVAHSMMAEIERMSEL